MIRNWGTFAPEELASHNIGVPAHPEHGTFLEVLHDPRLREGFVEFWGFYGVDRAAVRPASTSAPTPREAEHDESDPGPPPGAGSDEDRYRVGGSLGRLGVDVALPARPVVRDRHLSSGLLPAKVQD